MAGRSRTPKRRGRPSKSTLEDKKALLAATPVKTSCPLLRPNITNTPLERASAALKPAGLSGRLPCRDAEQDRISEHLRAALRRGHSEEVLYISGMPGTGKTAAVSEAIRELQDDKKNPSFVYVHVNAMRLGTPAAVFSEILSHLPGCKRGSAAAAHGEAQRFFHERKATDPTIILLIDEIDQLVTKSQAVLYSVFDWLSIRRARLVLAAISNTMDLPERMLPRVASRFEIVHVDFVPYTRDQIHMILGARLRRHDAETVFTADALKICAARIAAGSGDVRKALQLCRRAVEILQRQTSDAETPVNKSRVELVHLEAAAKDMLYQNPAAAYIKGLSQKTRRFLVAMVLELRRKEADVVPLRVVASRYEKLTEVCSGHELPSSGSHAEDGCFISGRLEAINLIAQQGRSGALSKGLPQGPVLMLGEAIDREDLTSTLLNVEEDPGVRELLRD